MKGARWLIAGALAALGACYSVPTFLGPFRCTDSGQCGDDYVCDDGVCCRPTSEPMCRSYALEGGLCADGGVAQLYFQDLDRDGYGNQNISRLYCAPPVFDPFTDKGGDCNDNPENDIGKLSYPGAVELCDGLDNDCDGTRDNGLPTQITVYADQDLDGYGDPAQPLQVCAVPPGFVTNSADCGPDDPQRHPGAPERCNDLDDDCNGVKDENPIGVGSPCAVPNGVGVCAQGLTACLTGALQCLPATPPSRDVCDGLDNDCDGEVDERPDCGGPHDIMALDAGLTWGARDLNRTLAGGTSTLSCTKNLDGGTNESFTVPIWSGNGATSHVFWVESARGWDLSQPGTKIRLRFLHQLFNGGSPPWNLHGQPVIYLCNRGNTYIRYVHFDGGTSTPAFAAGSGNVDQTIPLNGNNEWNVGINSSVDFKDVVRMEVLIQPNGTNPSFILSFDGGSGFFR